MPGWIDHVLVVLLLATLPFHGVHELRRLKLSLSGPEARLEAYRRIITSQWLAAAVLLGFWLLVRRPWGALGIRAPAGSGFAVAAVVVAVLIAGMAIQLRGVRRDPDGPRKVRNAAGPLLDLLPATPAELRRFTWLGVTAGIVEELLFRGYLFWYFGTMMAAWPAIALTSVAFGLGHAYQGLAGILKTAGIGLIFGWVCWLSGSLWLPMLLHAMIDVLQGRMIYFAITAGPPDAEPAAP